MAEKKGLGKKKSIAVAVGMTVATVAGAVYIFTAGNNNSPNRSIEQNIANTAQNVQLRSGVANSTLTEGDITQETMLPEDNAMVQQHREQERRRFEQASNSLGSYISGEDQLAGFKELEEQAAEEDRQKQAAPDGLDLLKQRREELERERKQREEEAARLERERQAARSNNGQNNSLLDQLENQRRMMAEMQAQLNKVNQQLAAQQGLNKLDISNEAEMTDIMASIINETLKVPTVKAYDLIAEGDVNAAASDAGGRNLIRPDGSKTSQASYEFDKNFDINDSFTKLEEESLSGDKTAMPASMSCANADDCIKIYPGDTKLGLLFTQINSDDVGFAVARIVSGPLAGAQLFGKIETNIRAKTVRLMFSEMSFREIVYPINAMAVDPATKRPGLADDVNNHYFSRYASLIASGVMTQYADTLQDEETSTNSLTGEKTTTSSAITDEKERWLYAIGKSLDPAAQEMAKNFNRPPTITVESVETGTIEQGQIGVMFISSLEVPVNN